MSQWRTDGKLGRTLYKDEECIGMVDTPELAEEIVRVMTVMTPGQHFAVMSRARLEESAQNLEITLTSTQARCTELLEECRRLRAQRCPCGAFVVQEKP